MVPRLVVLNTDRPLQSMVQRPDYAEYRLEQLQSMAQRLVVQSTVLPFVEDT